MINNATIQFKDGNEEILIDYYVDDEGFFHAITERGYYKMNNMYPVSIDYGFEKAYESITFIGNNKAWI